MVLVHDTLSRHGLQVYQVSLKNGFQVIERTRFVTDRQTHGRTDARGKTICLPTLSGGDIMKQILSVPSLIFWRILIDYDPLIKVVG